MATKPSDVALSMAFHIQGYPAAITFEDYRERLSPDQILEIETDATILDTHLAAIDRKMAEALVKNPKIADVLLGDVESDGEAVCFTSEETAIKALTAAIHRAREEAGE